LSALVSLSLAAGCTGNNPPSNNPDAGNYDGYYSEKGDGGSSGSGGTVDPSNPNGPKPRSVSSTKGAPGRKGRPLTAKKPPVPGGGTKPRPPVKPTEELVFEGFLPSNAPAGSVIEIFGSGFGKLGDTSVTIGGKRQKVLEVGDGHLVVQTTATADGVVALVRPRNSAGVRTKGRRMPVGATTAKSTAKYHSIPIEGGFGAARTDVAHGLVAKVFDIGKEVTELPSGDFFGGTPLATFAMDTVDVPAGTMTGGFVTGDLKQWFALHVRGSLNITEAGTYKICLNAGDGAQLYLDENKIVDNDGVHDTTQKCEELAVEPGEYALDILYFQGTGDRGLQLTWGKDGAEQTVIPKENLFPPDDARSLASK
ncbi:MAG TPA: PA14 domain-containing protein, partial [Nannocystaceae bacterium]|nr:PA14 domain-containing protein [Nannocystaceae bacterium]